MGTGEDNKVVKEDIRQIVSDLGDLVKKFGGKTVLITGGAGFLGKYLVWTLNYLNKNILENPCKIIVLDNFITGLKGSLQDEENIEIREVDISKPFRVEDNIDYIFHAASIAAPLFYNKFKLETIDVGFIGTKNVLELAREKDVKSFLFFSTSEVYGNPDPKFIPTPETYLGNVSCTGPRSAYDEPKRIGETLCMTYAEIYNIPVKIVRPFNVYGPGMRLDDGRGAINFVVSALNGEKIPVYGDGRNTR
ncbi:MAG: NAD-dependent epimerase/dehydratase family protein, partial [Nanoarchaeota archaeon]